MKKLFVNKEACIGCGACVAIDDTHFDFDESGYSEVVSQENIQSEEVQNAIASCPTNAINYTECDNEEKKCECSECHCENSDCEN